MASWYGVPYHGRKASNGEVYDMYQIYGGAQDSAVENRCAGLRIFCTENKWICAL